MIVTKISKMHFLSLRLFTFTVLPSIFFCQPQKFSGTNGPAVRYILQPCT
jgi:hypothetical protein